MKHKGTQFDLTPLPEGAKAYHGSPHGFAPGDRVNPTPDTTHMGGESAAFGVTNTSTAGYFGLQGATPDAMREGQGRLFSSVYEVEPVSPDFQMHPADQKSYDIQKKYDEPKGYNVEKPANNMPIDRAGFNVKRHAAFAFPEYHSSGTVHEVIQETP
jgi:hypothetical protein